MTDALKLTTYFGERDRVGDRFLADALSDVYAKHELLTSLVLRGVEGFGAKQALRTDRLLTLSEDLPIVSVAVDRRERIEAALADVRALEFDGLVTLERAQLPRAEPDGEAKLTVHLGRRDGFRAVVSRLHAAGVAGATVLLGIDGTAHGVRRRAGFFSRNADVPAMVIAVGAGERLAPLVDDFGPLVTLERVRVCKRDGRRLAEPHVRDSAWQKLTVYMSEQAGIAEPLLRDLRRARAAGATTLRGVWGYHGDHAPHGDTLWQLRRRVPLVMSIVDTGPRMRDWFEIVDRHTARTGLVTSELVPLSERGLPR